MSKLKDWNLKKMYDEFELEKEDIEKLSVENKRSRVFCGILYFDDESQKNAISHLQKNTYNSIAIIHDRCKNSQGELKKAHIHFIIRFSNPRYLESVANELSIKPNYIQACSSFQSYSCYMVHLDEPFKEQYLPQEAFGRLFNEFLKCVSKIDDESVKVQKIINYICDNQIMSIKNLALWVCQNGLYDVFRRNYSLFRDIKFEKDGKL